MQEIIQFQGVSYIYNQGREDEVLALEDVTLKVEEGEFLVVLGHNGSGKSTLARLINALLIPSRGRVIVDNLSTDNPQSLWKIRQNAGMVFQNPDNQIVGTTVEDDVAFGPENLGLPSKIIRERVDEALKRVGIPELAKRPPHFLSGGQKQKVAIAAVISMRPRCLVLDEPTALLDPEGRLEVLQTVKELNENENISVVYITHFMEEAVTADRIVVMEQGRIVMEGSPRKIFPQVEKLRELGLDVPQVTELALLLRKEQGFHELPEDILETEELVNYLCSSR
ncbi:energy-coupling factor transporter ATPase [Candidatus Contubernalis alkaliaceticus]|uniref:energy-coupling factor transporter ATPase n=1 Tax=Candidatus Contubernalis alkaliaceticus TaxID=338645 RepID=UPI001F4C3E72|nr:energy-coupling factor transporter ATPase [Candidatus Contubernalis alkalaceticus]UNC90965.1 energy-coupling factor transporter ATPase [Candidatus Contubernalis alkalaceticus]